MGSFYNTSLFRNSIICLAASSFITGTITTPLYAFHECKTQFGINFNDIAFVTRIEKLVERAKRYKGKLESKKLIEVMLEIKTEVEAYTGKRVDIEAQLNQIEMQAIKNGARFKRGEMNQIRNMLKKCENKQHHRAVYLAECNMYDISYNEIEWNSFYKYASSRHKKEDKEEVEVPLRVTIGVTASLCGYFLSFIPHPYAQAASKVLIAAGIEMCVEGTITRVEENQQKEKNKKK